MTTPTLSLIRRWLRTAPTRLAIAGLGLMLVLAACGGGGGGVASVGSGGTGAFSVGTVTGFGSVIVNGLRYDDSAASVSDEDGPRSRSDLKLGMVVKVRGTVNAGASSANSIMFDSELLGPVSALNNTAKTVTILGQKVLFDASSVFDASLPQGFASIQANQVLEVHGYLNPLTNELQATLVELKSNPNKYKLSGIVRNLQTSAKTLQIGSETIGYSSLNGSQLPASLANGVLIKARLSPTASNTSVTWNATKLSLPDAGVQDEDQADVEGLITAFVSSSQFTVGTVPVDARNASVPSGTVLQLGARVKVEGSITGGVLIAREVKLETSGKSIDLRGTISAADTVAKTFVVRGVTVSYATGVQFDNGTAANLVNGANVEVKGQLAPNSAVVNATRIKF